MRRLALVLLCGLVLASLRQSSAAISTGGLSGEYSTEFTTEFSIGVIKPAVIGRRAQ